MSTPDRRLTTRGVVFLVVAAAAPLAAVFGNIPIALIRGNSIVLPTAFVLAGIVLACFCIGFVEMTKRVSNQGAFYVLVARGLGKPAAAAAVYLASLGYLTLSMGLAAAFGYFFATLAQEASGVTVPWWVFSSAAIALVGFLGYRNVTLSARVLGVLMALEFAVLILLDLFIVGDLRSAAFPPGVFDLKSVMTGSFGVAAMLAFVSFVGFESVALYGEETAKPEVSIPRAAYIALGLNVVFYILTSWILIGGAGGAQAPAMARQEGGNFVLTLAQQYGGETFHVISAVLLCTSLLASQLALHNAGSRYLFALGREGFLPRPLGEYHPRHLSPHTASIAVTVVTAIVVGGLGLAGADPYLRIAAALIGLGTLSIVATQALTALAVVAFFRGRADRRVFSGLIAPVIGCLGLTIGVALAVAHYATLTGTDDPVVNAVPVLALAVAALGAVAALVIRGRHPRVYATFAATQLRKRAAADFTRPDVVYRRRYVIVGAGPSGMIMARALLNEGVPFDWFERNSDFGGIWDIDSPGSPMYESAHFISSKYTSGFYGAPMPDELPDYPSWAQILAYIRNFGRNWGLYQHVTFNTSVVSAKVLPGDRWRVSLSDGRVLEYDGLIAAPGVTWHASSPSFPDMAQFRGEIRHSVTYRSPQEFTGKRVLIVGAGNSGVDIACDAARQADRALFSVRRGYRYVPKHIAGVPTDALILGVIEPPRGLSVPADTNVMLDALVGDLTRFGLPAPTHDALASHPIMNTQVLHYLSHGDLIARPDIQRFTADGVVFKDGTNEALDLVLLCTGYEYQLPFLDPALFTWKSGHPQLYLNVFNRRHDSLYVLGFIEFADAAYKRFDEMAQLVVMDIRARETGVNREELLNLKANDQPDLRGGIAYIDSPRHANYVHSAAYQAYLSELRDKLGWPDLDHDYYDAYLQGLGARHSAPTRSPTFATAV